eukprot:CAMPEP_0178385222 /NCGR_PEP_ID=MMETSP0689_2-20121128/7923_1 /TAXON_ID=160604 /ORGANISM="Amphidinium massartii, Strain CS-259" /LENGTH=53 /DNA_ID=CAMNT_0020005501 /DNA_START=145 /DNA_END=303 /DNA_ORIENTATION=+
MPLNEYNVTLVSRGLCWHCGVAAFKEVKANEASGVTAESVGYQILFAWPPSRD